LDTLGDLDGHRNNIKKISNATGLPIIKKKKVGLQGLQNILSDAMEQI